MRERERERERENRKREMKRTITTEKKSSKNVTVIFNKPRYSPRSRSTKSDTCGSVRNVIQGSKINSEHAYEFQLEFV